MLIKKWELLFLFCLLFLGFSTVKMVAEEKVGRKFNYEIFLTMPK
jgi:hypothetical protein